MPQETFVYGGDPQTRWTVAIIAVNEPAWFLDLGMPDWINIRWHQRPKLATTWPSKETADQWLRDLKVGIYDEDMEVNGYAWAVGQEYRIVKLIVTEKFEAKVV